MTSFGFNTFQNYADPLIDLFTRNMSLFTIFSLDQHAGLHWYNKHFDTAFQLAWQPALNTAFLLVYHFICI